VKITAIISLIKLRLSQGGCRVVPGLPRVADFNANYFRPGGTICGFAARRKGQVFAWQCFDFSPLWGILFIAFGIGSVVTRTSEWLPLVRNIVGF